MTLSLEPLPAISVVVTKYNRWESLAQVLPPLLAVPAASEVVVVDDGSEDGSRERLRAWASSEPRVSVVLAQHDGRGAARELGLRSARESIVLLLDDVLTEPGLVTGHASHHRGGQVKLVVGYTATQIPLKRRAGQAPTHLYAREYEQTCATCEAYADENLLDRRAATDPRRAVPRFLDPIVDFLAMRGMRIVSTGLLRAAYRAGGWLRLWVLEEWLARVLRQIEIRVGYNEGAATRADLSFAARVARLTVRF